jgi:TonB family protein
VNPEGRAHRKTAFLAFDDPFLRLIYAWALYPAYRSRSERGETKEAHMSYLLAIVLAFSTATPYIHIVPLGPAHVGVATHKAGCDVPAAINGTPFFEMPSIAAEQGVSGLAEVKIDLTSAGSLAASKIFASSGNRWLDEAALLSARLTSYTSETVNCEHVAGSYLYEVEF